MHDNYNNGGWSWIEWTSSLWFKLHENLTHLILGLKSQITVVMYTRLPDWVSDSLDSVRQRFWFWSCGLGLLSDPPYWISPKLPSIFTVHPINACDLLMAWCSVCVSMHVRGGTADFLSLRKSDVWKQREHLLSPCTLLQNHKVQMTSRSTAHHTNTLTLGQTDWMVQQEPLETETDQRGHNINMPYVLVYGYRWPKELYQCPYTTSLIDCTVSQRINDSFRFHTSHSATQPVSPDSYQPQTHSSLPNTDKLTDIIMGMLSITDYELTFFI